MLLAVPSGRSFLGCGTTTVIGPFLNLWCDPLMLTSSKPSALRRLTMSRLLRSIHKYIHTTGIQRNMPDAGRGQPMASQLASRGGSDLWERGSCCLSCCTNFDIRQPDLAGAPGELPVHHRPPRHADSHPVRGAPVTPHVGCTRPVNDVFSVFVPGWDLVLAVGPCPRRRRSFRSTLPLSRSSHSVPLGLALL